MFSLPKVIRRPAVSVALLFVGWLGGCGPDPSQSPIADAAAVKIDAAVPLDLSRARWVHEPVLPDLATSSSGPSMTIAPDGELLVAWTEEVSQNPSRQAIKVAEGHPGFSIGVVIGGVDSSMSRGRLFAGSGAVHLVSEGSGGVSHFDIFYTRRENGAWGGTINLTARSDPSNLYSDGDARVFESGGEVSVIYKSRIFSEFGAENAGVYLLRFTTPSQPGTPIALLDRDRFNCSDVAGASEVGGAIHLLAICTDNTNNEGGELFYLSNRSGSFVRQTVDLAGGMSPLSVDIAVGKDGMVHLLWNARVPCGQDTCTDIFYSRNREAPIGVTAGDKDGGFIPRLGVDSQNRVVVAFHRFGAVDDVLWTYADGGGFVRVQLATPGTPATVDFSVGNLVFHPLTDRPHIVFVRGGQGVGTDIIHGELVP